MRYARYLRMEKYIAASDTGGITERWRYGRRLLEDDTATTRARNLRHGVLDRLITHATTRGYNLSEREIRWRLACARAYETEAQIGTAGADFGTWTDLRAAGFPPVEVPENGEPYDPRDADERDRDARNAGRRLLEHGADGFETICADYWPTDTYGPTSTLTELAKYAEEMRELTERFLRRDEEREKHLQALIAAVDGDMNTTWEDAETALRQQE
jgi:hypothetical protein